jgi:hypothetical protein
MSTELTNLLPLERKNALVRDYILRFWTLACVFVGFLFIAHSALLAPSYVYVTEQQKVEEMRLNDLSERREVSGFTDISERVTAFAASAKTLEELRTLPSASDSVRAILSTPRAGIRITSFVFSAPQGKSPGRMQVSGIAATRESLRSFDSALNGLSFVQSTDLPFSAYAKENDIPFQIALVLDFATP